MEMFVSEKGRISLECGEFITGFKKGGIPVPVFRYSGGSRTAQEKFVKASLKEFPESVLKNAAKDCRQTLIDDIRYQGSRYGNEKDDIKSAIQKINSMTDEQILADYFHVPIETVQK